MSEYAAPLRDMRFVLTELVGLERIGALPGCDQVTPELVDAILEEAGRFAGEVLAPLNHSGDKTGSVLDGDAVRTPPGFREAYAQFVSGGGTHWAATRNTAARGCPWWSRPPRRRCGRPPTCRLACVPS